MKSIRRRLLWSLVTLYTLSWLLLAAVIYFASRHEIEELFDAELARSAGMMADLGIGTLQEMASATAEEEGVVPSNYGHEYEQNISFQLWTEGRLRLRSASAPSQRLANSPGFSDETVGGTSWRVFGLHLPEFDCDLYVAENYAVRNEVIATILWNTLLPLVSVLPLLVILLRFVIARGLDPLRRVAADLRQRGPDQLESIGDDAAPEEIHPLTREINRLLGRLDVAFDRERRFNSNAAHELRTPLASIRAHAQVARRLAHHPDLQLALERVFQGVDQSAHLVDQMLTLARLEPGTRDTTLVPVDLLEIAYEVLNELDECAIEKHIDLEVVNTSPQLAAYLVPGSATGLRVLLRNLVDNAIRYTPPAGRVDIEIGRSERGTVLSVVDTGPGIPESEHKRVFDRFYRYLRHDGYGCGLGLSIVASIAESHSAQLRLSRDAHKNGLRVDILFTHCH